MRSYKVLHIVAVSFSINYFLGKQFSYLKNKTGNVYHLGCSPSEDFLELSEKLVFKPFEIVITRSISPYKDLIAIFKIYSYIKRNNIDKVIGHSPKGGMVAMIASFLANVPDRIYFRHGIFYETSSGIKRVLLKNIDRLTGFFATKVVCVSKSVKEISEKDKLNNSDKNLILGLGTCNGVDTECKYNPHKIDVKVVNSLKEKYNLSKNDFVVGFVGRLVKDKGVGELIASWDIVKTKYNNAKLLLVGPIEERDPISDESRYKILNDPSIIFTDFVMDASPFYALMDVFILPSYREGFPTVSLEASSMELPVLITRATGCEEAIIENETGIFITTDPADIADKISLYLDNPQIAIKHGGNGRIFVRENFEQTKIWDIISKELQI